MTKPGETIDNPLSGDKIIFRTTAEQTNGAYVEFDHILKKGGGRTAEHIHLKGTEDYEVLSGTSQWSLNGETRVVNVGDKVHVPPGTIHTNPWNPNDEILHLLRRVSPEAGLEQFYETQFGLARDGKTTSTGDMKFLQTMVVGDAIKSETYFFPRQLPIFIQRIAIPIFAFIGRLTGLKARYTKYSDNP